MSALLLVIPAGWIQLDWEYVSNNFAGLDAGAIKNNVLLDTENALKAAMLIADDASLQEMKLIDDTYFIIRLG